MVLPAMPKSQTRAFAFPRRGCARVSASTCPSKAEGAGKAGRSLHPQSGVRKMEAHTSIVTTGFNRVIPAFPARVVLTDSFVLSPVSMTF
jgi:hypothetical protein